MKKYVMSFQPGFNPKARKGSIVVFFSDKTREILNDLNADDFNAMLNILEQRNVAYNNGYFYCDYPHNAVELINVPKNNIVWEE